MMASVRRIESISIFLDEFRSETIKRKHRRELHYTTSEDGTLTVYEQDTKGQSVPIFVAPRASWRSLKMTYAKTYRYVGEPSK